MVADIRTGKQNGDPVLGLSIDALPTSANGWPLRPFQIVSLWDMFRFNAALLSLMVREVEIWRSNAHARVRFKIKDIDKKRIPDIQQKLNLFKQGCENSGLETVPPHIERMLEKIEGKYGEYVAANLLSDSEELYHRIQDEVASILCMRIPKERQEFYEKPLKGWGQIVERFPMALTDTEEAHKCFALDRYSAAVFHSLQIIEVGLIELGTFIGVNDPTSGWTSVAQRLKKIIETKYQDLSVFEKANRPFLEQLQGTVEALKNAWRNKISHAHGKLTVMTGAEFHPDVTQEILSASRAFMRRLAEGLPKSETTPT